MDDTEDGVGVAVGGLIDVFGVSKKLERME
jgi:hypothetical protein